MDWNDFTYWLSNTCGLLIISFPLFGSVSVRNIKWATKFHKQHLRAYGLIILTITILISNYLNKHLSEIQNKKQRDSDRKEYANEISRVIAQSDKAKAEIQHNADTSKNHILLALATMGIDYKDGIAKTTNSNSELQKKTAQLIKDSIKIEKKYNSLARPALKLDNLIITKKEAFEISLQAKLLAIQSTVYNPKIDLEELCTDDFDRLIISTLRIDTNVSDNISPGDTRTIYFTIFGSKVAHVFLHLKGSFNDEDNKSMSFDEWARFDMAAKVMTKIPDAQKALLLQVIKNQNK
ncbi:MAG: hypothetical protein V4592_07250 [Bacteroidota bacterium]